MTTLVAPIKELHFNVVVWSLEFHSEYLMFNVGREQLEVARQNCRNSPYDADAMILNF
jgi:hypothetical protein